MGAESGFSELTPPSNPMEPLNYSLLDAPSSKLFLTGYRRAPNLISQHWKQEL